MGYKKDNSKQFAQNERIIQQGPGPQIFPGPRPTPGPGPRPPMPGPGPRPCNCNRESQEAFQRGYQRGFNDCWRNRNPR